MLVRKIIVVGNKLEISSKSYFIKEKEKYLVLVTSKRERKPLKIGNLWKCHKRSNHNRSFNYSGT